MIRTIAVAVLCLFSTVAHAQRGATRVASQFEWRQDVEFLANELPKIHPDPWARVTEEAFRAEVDALMPELPTMSEGQTTFEISRLVGMLGDQNTIADVSRPMQFAPVLPIRFVWLSDGLYITGAATVYRGMIGSKVLGMGGIPIEQLAERAAKYGSWENETTRQQVVADLLRFPSVLVHCGIDQPRIKLPIEFEREGEERIREVTAIPLGGPHVWHSWSSVVELPMPVSLAAANKPFASIFIAPRNAMYIACKTQDDDRAEPFAEFVTATLASAKESGASRCVIDLRFNDGRGDSILTPLIDQLDEGGWFDSEGDVIVLTGRLTGATAAQDAMRFRERGAVLIGVPTGGNPSGCTGRQELVLPNSSMKIYVSTKGRTPDGPSTVTPDITLPWDSHALFNAEDPALSAALDYTPETAGEG